MPTRTTLLACLLVLVVASGGVAGTVQPSFSATNAATTITECTVITEPGEYVLGDDIGPSGGEGSCLFIYSDGVTIDGNGYAVDGTLDLGDYEQTNTSRGTELRDLTVTSIRTTRGVSDLTLNSVVVTQSLDGLFFSNVTVTDSRFGQITMNEDSGDIVITNSTFVDGGVTFWEYVTNARIENSEFENSRLRIGSTGTATENVLVANNSFDDSSISTAEGGRDIEIRSNEFVNGSSINLLTPGLVVGNNISGGDVGISVGLIRPADDENHLRIVDNRITDNRVGVRVHSGSVNPEYLHIEGNTFDGNTEFGVQNVGGEARESIVDARNNSWGDPSGPSSAPANDSDAPFADPVTGTLANGSGDAVSEGSETPGVSNVRFDPVRGDEPVEPKPEPEPETGYYQVDFVAGDVIEQFGAPDSDEFYSDQSRLIRFLHGSAGTPVERSGSPSTLADDTAACVAGDSFEVSGDTATVQFTVEEGCELDLALVSYEKPGPGWSRSNASEQLLVDADEGTFGPGEYELTVSLPSVAETTVATSVEFRSLRP